ncbi:MAG TPA: hypothetical protein VJT50_07865 [Pyrinomonadaceae bacterium]|nr:hypothetical protein [Pyrinomonadaceae bacterium]
MSKNISRIGAFAAVTVVFFSALIGGTHAQRRPEISSRAAKEAAIVTTTAAILEETSKIRELPILRPVKSGAQSRAEIEKMLIKNLYEQMTTTDMHATEVAYRKLGLAPPTFEYRPFIIKLLSEQVAGYYDPVAQEFYLADWLELETQKPVMAHELTHALQDQHFNLRRFQKWPHGDGDAELAAHALIEGDATVTMMVYMAKNPLVALAFTRSLTSGVSTEVYNQAPRMLRETLVFPYLQGSEWATGVYKREGFAGLSKAFSRLPASTEQILHQEKYVANEQPLKISLPDLSSVLNDDRAARAATTATAGWHRIDSDVNGEWGYYLLLDQFLNAPQESRRAAAGWAGDRFDVYEGANPNQVMIAQVSTWDTEPDAREFFDAYVKRTKLRYPEAKSIDDEQMRNSTPETRNSYSWQTSEGEVVVALHGSRVTVLEGLPTENVTAKVLSALQR